LFWFSYQAVPRGNAAAVDAYLSPVVRRYVENFLSNFHNQQAGKRCDLMQSDGGLVSAEKCAPMTCFSKWFPDLLYKILGLACGSVGPSWWCSRFRKDGVRRANGNTGHWIRHGWVFMQHFRCEILIFISRWNFYRVSLCFLHT
jgi:hypothetical protein